MAVKDDAVMEVSHAEICACAHVADTLLKLNERVLAEQIIEAIYCLISSSRRPEIPVDDRGTSKPKLALITNERFKSQSR
jgi:hypothetical protein